MQLIKDQMQRYEERELVEFENQGIKIFGVLHKPLAQTKAPAVLFCHGLAGHRIGKHRMYVALSECLSRVGIASFRFDFRGSGDSEGEFGEMTLEGEVSDAVKALEFLTIQEKIDPNRIGIFGRSFGGAISIFAAQKFGNVKSIALWSSVFDAEQWEKQWEMLETGQIDEKTRHELMRINGQLPSLHFYKELFNMDLKKELRALQNIPMQLIHGEKDPRVGIEHSEKYANLRKDAPAQTEFIKLEHSDHDFTYPEERVHAINMTCQWFAKTL
ncbi:putative uncharacterized protein [Waddlia chondrophila 2032/99]|uniref:Peptidase S9 prolyl oligopeptidase catalytic domain-containing protein n=1 Tax=Waddlia chondrophila 2032/99 TaxID=765953 RepID=F8LDN6_9BACT|nr:putative uncharacterized protein [Waddlia chondrophila 2032/99]